MPAVPPVNVTVQYPATSVWSTLLPPLIGLVGAAIGAVAAYYATRFQADRAYRRERQDTVYEEAYQLAHRLDDAIGRGAWDTDNELAERIMPTYREFADGGLAVRVRLFAASNIHIAYLNARKELEKIDIVNELQLDPETELGSGITPAEWRNIRATSRSALSELCSLVESSVSV